MPQLKLNKDVATYSAVAIEDMLPLKTYLKKFGAYDVPSYGMTEYPDNELFEGIKNYQRKNNLMVKNYRGLKMIKRLQHGEECQVTLIINAKNLTQLKIKDQFQKVNGWLGNLNIRIFIKTRAYMTK